MGRLKKQLYQEFDGEFSTDQQYNLAYKKVKKIKGFYSHLRVYLIVNVIIVISNVNRDFFGHNVYENGLLDWRTYSTALYWGIALLIHALTVFGPDAFFSRDWEQRKIKEYMEKESSASNKWE